jgi:uncharacterized metal-binding protein
MKSDQVVVFLCSGVTNLKKNKLSHSIALRLQDLGIGEIGTLSTLSLQHSLSTATRKKMIFINDCNASCVKMLTHGFASDEFIYIDVAPHKNSKEFQIEKFVEDEVLPRYYDLIRRQNDTPDMETATVNSREDLS